MAQTINKLVIRFKNKVKCEVEKWYASTVIECWWARCDHCGRVRLADGTEYNELEAGK